MNIIFNKLISMSSITLLTIGMIGCAGPNYAPINGRAPIRGGQQVQRPQSNFSNFPAPPSQSMNNGYPLPNTPLVVKPVYNNDVQVNNPPIYNNEPAPAGYYRVMPGDTVYKIARENNISPKEVIEWNAFENPNSLQLYQLIRISPSTGLASNKNTNSNNAAAGIDKNNPNKPINAQNIPVSSGKVNLIWPVKNSTILNKFNGKGIDFSGRIGDPIYSSGDGTVIYANNMRGYGNLIIVAHSPEIVTAYAHLQQILVKEQQKIKQGQKIALMGNTQSEQVKLHFEVRKKSEPVDPIPYIK